MVCIEKLGDKKTVAAVIDEVFHTKDFSFLTKPTIELPQNPDRDFSQDVKSRTFIKAALEGLPSPSLRVISKLPRS